jgi:hypothetical protein
VCAATQLLRRQLGEEALDEVQPAGAGRCEVKVKARMRSKPALHGLGLVGGVVVEDQVDVELGRDLLVDPLQELLELDRAVAGMQGAVTLPEVVSRAAKRLVVPARR